MFAFTGLRAFFNVVYCLATGLVGYSVHHSIFWAFLDGILAPATWVKWAMTHEVSWNLINSTFHFLSKTQ
jgi:hypothetical protein